MTRWLIVAGTGALIGAASSVFLLRADVRLGPIYLAGGCIAAGVDVWLAQRRFAPPPIQ